VVKYNVTVNSADPAIPGLNLTVQVDADNVIDALEAAKPAMGRTVDAIRGQLPPPVPDGPRSP
jgi:hypothetical protein